MTDDMSKTIRLIIFLCFTIAFLISAPLLVLYTAGYRFDIAHGRIVHTAVLSLSSEPRNATVLIDDESFSDRTPAVIETILPGDHLIKLEKTGYLPWETTLTFKSRDARVIGPICLFLDTQPQQTQTLSGILFSIHSASNQFAYVLQESSWLEVWNIITTTSEKKLLMRLPYNASSQYELSWSTNGTYLMLKEIHGSFVDISITGVENGVSLELPNALLNADSAWWDIKTDHIAYVRTQGVVQKIDVTTGNILSLGLNVDLLSVFNNHNISLTQNGTRAVVSYQDGETASIITYLPLGTYEFANAPDGLVSLYETRRHRLILIDPNESEQPILFNEDVLLWAWNPTKDTLLYSSGYDLKQYVRSAHQTHTLTRLSTPIEFVSWFPIGSVVIYQSNGQTIALNLHDATTLSQTSLVQDLSGSFWIDQKGEKLHLIEENIQGYTWWTRDLQN